MLEFVQYQDQTSQFYTDLMGKLERMNSTLGLTLHFLDHMQSRIEDRLHTIQNYLGWAGLSLTAMWSCIAHTCYFVLFAVLQSFLRCPVFSRVMLLFIVPLNAAAEVNQQPALDLTSLSLLLVTLSLGHWFVSQLWGCVHIGGKRITRLPLAPPELAEQQNLDSSRLSYPPSSTPQKEKKADFLQQDDVFIPDTMDVSIMSPPHRKAPATPSHSTPRLVPQPALLAALMDNVTQRVGANDSQDFVTDSRSASPTPSIVSNSSLSGRHLCNAFTKTGKACKKRAALGQEYCRVHENGHLSYSHS